MAEPDSGRTLGAKIKLGLVGLVALLLLVFVLTNWDQTQLKFLGLGTLSMPRSILLLLSVAGGFALGWTARAMRARRDRKAEGS